MKTHPIVLAVAVFGLSGVAGCDREPIEGTTGSAAQSGEQAAAVIDDSVITTKVKTALLAEPEVNGKDISVTTSGGQVTLSGVVPAPQIMRAEQITRGVEGVHEVVNRLTSAQGSS